MERGFSTQKVKSAVHVCVTNVTRETQLAGEVEVADHGASRRKGLLGRDRLAPGEGLWITPCEAVHTFGMRFPIDLVFLDRLRRVVKIRRDVRAGRIAVCLRAQSVLELRAGSMHEGMVRVGDQLFFE